MTEELWQHAGVELHLGKTKVWNRAGVKPPHMAIIRHVYTLYTDTHMLYT